MVWNQKADRPTKYFFMETNRKYKLTAEEEEEQEIPCENDSW